VNYGNYSIKQFSRIFFVVALEELQIPNRMFSSEKGTWTLWLVHYVYEAIPINFYIHYIPLCCCVFARLCLFLLSPHSFSFIFFLFLFKSPIVSCTEHNGHYLCFNDLNCEERRHEKKEKPSTDHHHDFLWIFSCCVIVCAVLSCCYILLIHFALQLLISPSKARVSLCRFIDLASDILQQQQLPQPRDRVLPAAVRGQRKRGKKVFRLCVSKKYFLFYSDYVR
jgi:hypothetical protein